MQAVRDREEALVEVVASILACSTVQELFERLTQKLSNFVHFEDLSLLLYDEVRTSVVLSHVYSTQPHDAPIGTSLPLIETPAGQVIQSQQPLCLQAAEAEERFPRAAEVLRTRGVRSMCLFPLTSPTHRIGALSLATRTSFEYSAGDLALLELAMRPVAIAVENILNRERLMQERDRLNLLLEINNALVSKRDLQALFDEVSARLQEFVPHEFLSLALWIPEERQLRLRVAANRDSSRLAVQDFPLPLENTPSGEAFSKGCAQVYDADRLGRMYGPIAQMVRERNIRSMCSIPLRTSRGLIGTISVGSPGEGTYTPELGEILLGVADQLALALENALAFSKVEALNRRLSETKLYLEEELHESAASGEILGRSPGIRKVLHQIQTVAGTDATVLIYGETGSGKELVARAIHQGGPRQRGTFVKMNCAAIPMGLLESELFGHEKGAFTGAIAQKIGRFELAHQGTLFLDEVGEIPLELQPKLLRVLQEKEFERLGSVRTVRSDVRLVAATNRDLKKMCDANLFRSDLFYRLNVFPIHVPPLRDRREDIAMLAMHFTQEYARRSAKRITAIPKESLERLTNYHWPGNIRELQNLIERSVILSNSETLHIPAHELEGEAAAAQQPSSAQTMENVERETILRALKEANGVVGGAGGAAARLGMKRTTLLYRMEKLGITKAGGEVSR
jgi:formate hydrogenlyase transcriptional activator